MPETTAGEIGRNPGPHIGKTVSFPDYHGRPVTGCLAGAASEVVYAVVSVDDRDYSVFANTVVTVD